MPIKKVLYIILSALLGLVLSFLAHAFVEMTYLRITPSDEVVWFTHLGVAVCALPLWLTMLLLAGGIAGGILLGIYWWHKVYIEHKHWRFNK